MRIPKSIYTQNLRTKGILVVLLVVASVFTWVMGWIGPAWLAVGGSAAVAVSGFMITLSYAPENKALGINYFEQAGLFAAMGGLALFVSAIGVAFIS